MKVAIQLYGHLRTFRECAPALKRHILDLYDCDVFIHTWDQTEHSDKTWYNQGVKCKAEPVDKEIVSDIEKLYSPKVLKIESQNLFSELGYFGTHRDIQISLQGMKYMTYGQYMASQLRKNYETTFNVTYDYVIVIRPDVMPFVDLNLSSYTAEFEYNRNCSIHFVFNSEIKVKDKKIFNYPLVADCFYFAAPSTIDKITSIFVNFDYYYKTIVKIFPGQVENPEIAFFENIIQNGIVPRQYVNYFAIKRYNSKNDIKNLPPDYMISGSGLTAVRSMKIVKWLINSISNYAPGSVTRILIRICDKIGACGRYLQSLESQK